MTGPFDGQLQIKCSEHNVKSIKSHLRLKAAIVKNTLQNDRKLTYELFHNSRLIRRIQQNKFTKNSET